MSHDINRRGRFCIIEGCTTLTLSGTCQRHRAAGENDKVKKEYLVGPSPAQAAMAAARERVVKAKAKWTRVTVDVLRRVPHAGAAVELALAELDAAHADLDALTRRAIQEAGT